eukprot:scaffold16850_cov58-Phaeocystis_antarctica.AAC.8
MHLDDDREEENGRQGEAKRLADGIVNIRDEGRGDSGEEHAEQREEEGDEQLQEGTGVDEHAEAHEEKLFPRLEQLPREPSVLKVEGEEAQSPAESRRLLVKDRSFCLVEEDTIEQ